MSFVGTVIVSSLIYRNKSARVAWTITSGQFFGMIAAPPASTLPIRSEGLSARPSGNSTSKVISFPRTKGLHATIVGCSAFPLCRKLITLNRVALGRAESPSERIGSVDAGGAAIIPKN